MTDQKTQMVSQKSTFEVQELINEFKVQPFKMEENLITLNFGFGFASNNFMYSLCEDVMRKLIPMGIIKHLLQLYEELDFRKSLTKVPKVMTIESLSFGIILWLLTCAVSIVCFIVELLYISLKKVVRFVIGLILMFRIIFGRNFNH